ncbi:SprT family zinc-dependent metalloprotease [Thaumasiovibrio subtropicus]|uniref:SprT family zinc-dependent metalloprotease n=1 Tax=Thaumasiovibrio subtropicus TaxID=1891207 RepID=UPI001863C3F3|nr:SprT family zinc-dependent metalloprotease [Thaumasiovibrio subtropicus]
MSTSQQLTEAVQQQIIQRVHACIALASHRLNRQFELPSIRFNQRGKIAGSARLQSWELRFNLTLLLENQPAFLDDVVPHEVAHLITYALYGKVRPHGKEWQQIMLGVFKRPPTTTHNFNITNVQGQLFSYQCQCQLHQLTIRRHRKVQRGEVRYRCRDCGTTLTPSSDTRQP